MCHLPTDAEMYRDRIDGRLCEVVLYAVDRKVLYPKFISLTHFCGVMIRLQLLLFNITGEHTGICPMDDWRLW